MLKSVIQYAIRKRNPRFTFAPHVTSGALLALLFDKLLYFLRGLKLLLYFKVPDRLFLGRSVSFFNIHNMKFGRWVQLHEHVYLSALGRGKLEIGNNVSIGAFSRLVISTSFDNPGEYIRIGNNVGIGEFAYLGGGGGLEIGDSCIIGQYLSCHPENHVYDQPDIEIRFQGVTRKGIKIGSDCWIGAKVTILDGVIIGDHCVIAAGAVVTQSMPAYSVIGGIPARVLKQREPIESIKK